MKYIKKYLLIIFSIFYKYYDNAWDDPLYRTLISISLLFASLFNFIKGVIYFYIGYDYLGFSMTFLLVLASIFFLLLYKNKTKLLENMPEHINKKEKIIGYFIIGFLLLTWMIVPAIYGIGRHRH